MDSKQAMFMVFLGYASLSTVSLNNCFTVKNEPYIQPISLVENKEITYVVDFNKTIEAISCINEISNSSLKFRYRNNGNKAAVESDIVGSKETEGKWNCEIWMEKQCRLKYSFMVAVKHFYLNISVTNSDDATIANNVSHIVIWAREKIFWIQFQSNNPISKAWCNNDRNEYLDLNFISGSKTIVYSRSNDKIRGPWNCTFKDTSGAKQSFVIKIIWVTPSPMPTSSPASTSFRTTTEKTTTTETFQPSNIIRTTTESIVPDLPSSSTGPPKAPTKSTTEATNKHNTDTQVQWWKAVVGAAALLLILSFTIGVYVYRRKKETTAPQSDDSAPQPDGPSHNERVYYTIYDDDDVYYSYAYCKPEPTDANAAANAIYNVAN